MGKRLEDLGRISFTYNLICEIKLETYFKKFALLFDFVNSVQLEYILLYLQNLGESSKLQVI